VNINGEPGKRFRRRYRYYEILEISRNATQEEIREAFRHLAQKYHPDHNLGNCEAEAKFKKINEAYQVLSNPTKRATYDSSPAECPACWTYKVEEKAGNRWWCTACGCEFDAFGIPLSEKIERATIPERYRVRLAAFQLMQCSWCKLFFTQEPFLCPYKGKQHSSCFFIERNNENKLSEEERNKLLDDEKWWWRIIDLVRQAENNGVIKKCVRCGALNPNPDKTTCWKCKNNILDRCPNCSLPTLYFDLDDNCWKCSNAICYGKRFTFDKLAPRMEEPVYVLRGRCPNCKSDLHFDFTTRLWECNKCRKVYTYDELRKVEEGASRQKPSAEPSKEGRATRPVWMPHYKTPGNKKNKWFAKRKIPKWLIALTLIVSLVVVGLVISIIVGSTIPFWLLLGFSSVFAVEKWYYYPTRKHKVIGSFYRLLLNLSILSLLGLIIWSGIKLFSQQFVRNPLLGSLIFVAEFTFFVWMWRVVDKNSWRWPSMKLTVFSLVCLFLVFSFAGVQPMASYKDTSLSFISSMLRSSSESTLKEQNSTPITPTVTQPTNDNNIDPTTGIYKNYYLGLVNNIGTIAGSGCYDDTGKFIVLINNKSATNPTYNELVSFLRKDKTDEFPYEYTFSIPGFYYGTAESHVNLTRIKHIIDGDIQPDKPNICADFAERLHNNAEISGIRCAYVDVTLTGYPDPYHYGITSNTSHALNAFETTDRGLVYVDDTGTPESYGPPVQDSVVIVGVGREYNPKFLFPSGGWYFPQGSMGIVTSVFITWDGEWGN